MCHILLKKPALKPSGPGALLFFKLNIACRRFVMDETSKEAMKKPLKKPALKSYYY
jgi:hypothetical protein